MAPTNSKGWGTAGHARDLCLAAIRALPAKVQREAVLGDILSALEHTRHITVSAVQTQTMNRLKRYSMGLTD